MKSKLLIIALASALAACSRDPQYVQQPTQYAQPAPVVVNQPAHSSGSDLLAGAAIGAVAGHMMSRSAAPAAAPAPAPVVHKTTVVQKTVVVNKTTNNVTNFRRSPSTRVSLRKGRR